MEDNVKARLVQYLDYKGISKTNFGKAIGASKAYVGSIRSSIAPDKLKLIKEHFPDLNPDWLLTGDGVMIIEKNTTNNYGSMNAVNHSNLHIATDPDIIKTLKDQQETIKGQQEQINKLLTIIDKMTTNAK